MMFEYNATVIAVYDADTITVDIDLGFKQHSKGIKLRLFGINAPEMRGPKKADGRVSRDWLRSRILGKKIRLKTYRDKTGKYGRWLADVYHFDDDDNARSLNQQLVDEGLAIEANY